MRKLLPAVAALVAQLVVADEIAQPAGLIPVLHEVDVVVVGGGSGGVAAAVEAARAGAKVFLAAPRPYLGEDLCATYRLWLEPGETPVHGFGARGVQAGSSATRADRARPALQVFRQPALCHKTPRHQAGVAAE